MSNTVTDQFVTLFVAGDASGMLGLCRTDALVDIDVPQWRFQAHPEALRGALKENTGLANRSVTIGYHEATTDGAVVEVQTSGTSHGEPLLVREMWALRTDGEKITEWIQYCTGPWDAATITRQHAEAPMIRV